MILFAFFLFEYFLADLFEFFLDEFIFFCDDLLS